MSCKDFKKRLEASRERPIVIGVDKKDKKKSQKTVDKCDVESTTKTEPDCTKTKKKSAAHSRVQCKPSGKRMIVPKPSPSPAQRISKLFGARHAEIAKCFVPSLIGYSLAAMLATLYFTDWKAVLQYLPYYGGKYETNDK